MDNLLRTDVGDAFGFTATEMGRICSDFGHPEKIGETMEWYGGYLFGDAEVCNPWNIANYLRGEFRTDMYWVQTGDTSLLRYALSYDASGRRDDIGTLGSHGMIVAELDLSEADAYAMDGGEPWPLMVMTGYLRAERHGDGFRLSIPNRELYTASRTSYWNRWIRTSASY